MVFVFDTNSLEVLGNYYPERFPTFWEKFETAVESGEVISVREVYSEIERLKRNQQLWNWIQGHREMFVTPTAEETQFVREIFKVQHFQNLVGATQRLRGWPVADPFIIAVAQVRTGCVVTEEMYKPNAAKIPNVCSHFNIEWTNVEGFLARKGWRF